MSSSTSERYRSYGIGGAGNMRRPSTTLQAYEKLASLTNSSSDQDQDQDQQERQQQEQNQQAHRRRSSTFSFTNSDRRGSTASWRNLFSRRRSSVAGNEEEDARIEE